MSQTTLPESDRLLGAGFFDQSTGLNFEFHHPRSSPDVWAEYLDGASAAFARYGVGEAIRRSELEDGDGVSIFVVGRRPDGSVGAGLRFHGPLNRVDDSLSLVEMARSSEVPWLTEQVRRFVPLGVIEIKGAWSAIKGSGPHAMFKVFNRCVVYTLHWLRCEFAIATIAEQHVEPVIAGGAHNLGTESVPFPSEEYRTVLMVWRRSRLLKTTEPEQIVLERTELSQLRGSGTTGHEPASGRLADESWRPLLLDCRSRADRAIAQRLRATGARSIDRLDLQRAELDELRPTVSAEIRDEAPRFIYYPWRRTLSKIVGPKSFDLLRLDRNRNKITPEEQTSLRGLRIGIVGLSVGHSIAHLLAMEGLCGELRLADFDDIAITNLNRIPVSLLDIGIKKTVAAARRIAEIDPYLPVSIWPTGVTQDNVGQFLDGLDLVIEECDSLDVKVLLREAARERRLPVIMETSDRGLLDVERYDLEPDRDLFHGLLRGADAGAIAGLSARDKVPYVLQILEPDQVSTRAAASLAEVGKTLTTWPQLAGDVTLGAATTAAAVLRLVRDGNLASGRMRIDLDAALDTLADPATSPEDPPAPPVPPAPPTDPLELVAFAASRAPSGGNVQPWRFELSEAAFSVFLDPAKSVSMDVAYRGSYVAIGASLFNARVAAAAQGMLGPTELFPDARFDGPVGILHFDHGSDAALAGLFEPMLNRSTNRKKGTPRPIETQVLDHLGDIGAAESGGLHVLTDRDDLGIAAELLAESDRMRFLTPETHREMMSELRWPGRDSLETGIDVRTLELDGADLAALGIARRADVMAQLADWDAGHALGDNTRSSIASSSALLVMTARGSAPVDFVRCGQALMAVWLAAEVSGLAVHPMSPLFIYAQDEENFHSLVGNRYAARLAALAASFRQLVGLRGDEQLGLVLRLSHAAPTTVRSMRLPLDAVLSPRHADRQAERRHRPSGARVGAPSRYPGTLVAEPPVRIPPAPPPSASPPPPPAPTPGETFNPFDLDFMADPGPLLEYARNHQPVFFSPAVNAWVVTRFEDIDRVLRDPVRFTSKEILSIKDLISPVVADYFADSIPMEGTLIGVDPPEHTKLRRVLQGSLTPGRVKALETVVRGLAQGIVDGIGPAGRADLVGDLAYPLPLSTIARLMGIDDQDMAFFRQVTEDWADLSVAYISGVALEDQMVLARRVMAMHERVLELFAMRRAEPRDDLLSSLVAQQSSEHLSDHELLSLVPGLFLAGHETTANVLANALWHLLRVPGRWQDLVRNPSSVVGVVEEILRLDTSVLGLWRNISVDSEIAGVPVPAGQRLYLAFWSANRDGNRFPEPASFQPGRPAGGLHLAFGRGIHFCIGAPLARLELCTALTVLAESLPGLRLEDGFVPSYKPHFFLRGLAALPARW